MERNHEEIEGWVSAHTAALQLIGVAFELERRHKAAVADKEKEQGNDCAEDACGSDRCDCEEQRESHAQAADQGDDGDAGHGSGRLRLGDNGEITLAPVNSLKEVDQRLDGLHTRVVAAAVDEFADEAGSHAGGVCDRIETRRSRLTKATFQEVRDGLNVRHRVRFHTEFGLSVPYRLRYGKRNNCLMSQSTLPAEKRNGSLAAHFERIAAGRAIGRLRMDMKEAGYDIGQGTLVRLKQGDTGVRIDSIKKFAAYARMSEDELLREGADDSEFVSVRRADVQFSNGLGRVEYLEDDRPPLSFRADYLRRLNIPVGKAVVIDADGDSNYPKIVSGAVVLINSAERDRFNGEFYAYRADGNLLIKRLTRLPDGRIMATAENSDFKPKMSFYDEKTDDFEVIGRAVWMGVEL